MTGRGWADPAEGPLPPTEEALLLLLYVHAEILFGILAGGFLFIFFGFCFFSALLLKKLKSH